VCDVDVVECDEWASEYVQPGWECDVDVVECDEWVSEYETPGWESDFWIYIRALILQHCMYVFYVTCLYGHPIQLLNYCRCVIRLMYV
jgi:hypothetical protein